MHYSNDKVIFHTMDLTKGSKLTRPNQPIVPRPNQPIVTKLYFEDELFCPLHSYLTEKLPKILQNFSLLIDSLPTILEKSRTLLNWATSKSGELMRNIVMLKVICCVNRKLYIHITEVTDIFFKLLIYFQIQM